MKDESKPPSGPEPRTRSPVLVVLMVTAESMEQARAIARTLLEKRAVACVNIVPGVESHFWWKGNLESAAEVLIIAKTISSRIEEARSIVQAIHSYELFELLAVPVTGGNPDYLRWVAAAVQDR
ncbi:MAG TPA: divalent-cation tolerance protein CutA [Armatimonadota bacterium]|nr:divalent-cation tolerance protein CutA [Armatimonadota bacterium]